MPRPAPRVHTDRCTGCGTCVRVCPADAIRMDGQNKASIDCGACYRCLACIQACPEQALYADA